jgi:hypothetical protein
MEAIKPTTIQSYVATVKTIIRAEAQDKQLLAKMMKARLSVILQVINPDDKAVADEMLSWN